jgi:hypothetical protein
MHLRGDQVVPIYEKPYFYEGVLYNFVFLTLIFDTKKALFVKVLKAEDIERASKEGTSKSHSIPMVTAS